MVEAWSTTQQMIFGQKVTLKVAFRFLCGDHHHLWGEHRSKLCVQCPWKRVEHLKEFMVAFRPLFIYILQSQVISFDAAVSSHPIAILLSGQVYILRSLPSFTAFQKPPPSSGTLKRGFVSLPSPLSVCMTSMFAGVIYCHHHVLSRTHRHSASWGST